MSHQNLNIGTLKIFDMPITNRPKDREDVKKGEGRCLLERKHHTNKKETRGKDECLIVNGQNEAHMNLRSHLVPNKMRMSLD